MTSQTNFPFHSISTSPNALECLHLLSQLIESNESLDKVLHQWSNIMRVGFSHPNHIFIRIFFKNTEYPCTDFKILEQNLSFIFRIRGINYGELQLYYPNLDIEVKTSILTTADEFLFDLIGHRLKWYLDRYELTLLLLQQQKSLQTLIENDPDHILRIDSRFHVLYINPAVINSLEQITPYQKIYSLDEAIFSPEFFGTLKEQISYVFEAKTKISLEHYIQFSQTSKWFLSHIIPEKDFNEEVISVLIISSDISFQKESELKLQAGKEKAVEANKSKSDFITNISHELRSPLNSIIGFSELLIDQKCGTLSLDQIDMITSMSENAHHLLNLINDIIDISTIDANRVKIILKNLHMKEILNRLVFIFQERAYANNLNFSYDDSAERDLIQGDEVRIKQILFNLLSNAVKFTESGGEFGIKLDNSLNYIKIIIWDTGIGIPVSEYNHIFRPFYRINHPNHQKIPGTGLGLAITKNLIELHQGQIWIEPHLPKGTEIHFTIPLLIE